LKATNINNKANALLQAGFRKPNVNKNS
jgi:hypothetical protein